MVEKLLLSKTADLFSQCRKNAEPKFSAFLDGGDQAAIEDEYIFPDGFNTAYFGGFDGAERKILGVFPEWEEADTASFPIGVLKISSGYMSSLSHRDFLGALMSQGIDRNKTGDILIGDGAAYVFVCRDISEYFADNIKKIGNVGVKAELADISEIVLPEVKTEMYGAVCASYRLDAVTAAMCKLSRSASAKLIAAGAVKANHRVIENPSYSVKTGDLISARGYGRFVLESMDGKTAKGRIHITIKKYV